MKADRALRMTSDFHLDGVRSPKKSENVMEEEAERLVVYAAVDKEYILWRSLTLIRFLILGGDSDHVDNSEHCQPLQCNSLHFRNGQRCGLQGRPSLSHNGRG